MGRARCEGLLKSESGIGFSLSLMGKHGGFEIGK